MIREGYVERTIRQLRQAFARLLGKVDREAEAEELDARLDELYEKHLGLSRQALAALDADSQGELLRDRAAVALELLRGEQELYEASGRLLEAGQAGTRRAELEKTLSK